jgi:DNA-binding MarR family transcriptional regulator
LKEPRYGKPGVLTLNENRILQEMKPGQMYSLRDLSKRIYIDLVTVEEGMRRLYKKDLISAYIFYDAGRLKGNKYKVFCLRNTCDVGEVAC